MAIDLRGRSFLTLMDFTPEEVSYLLDLAAELKAKKKSGNKEHLLEGKNVVLLFDKTSTRTRSSFEVACLADRRTSIRISRTVRHSPLSCCNECAVDPRTEVVPRKKYGFRPQSGRKFCF